MENIPAFPKTGIYDPGYGFTGMVEDSQDGMTLRDYFAIRAPEIPSWYEYPEPFPVVDDSDTLESYNKKITEYNKNLYISWRYYYADLMLEGRKK